MKRSTRVVLSILAVLVFVTSCTQPPSAVHRDVPQSASDSLIGFASPKLLSQHFEKHGAEFNAASESEYLAMAQEVRDAPADETVLLDKRADGVTTRFDRRSGAFLACNPDRTIRTFFKPNDGEQYYRRQLKR